MVIEDIENLPELSGPSTIIAETDRYDGPIGGIIAIADNHYIFQWVHESSDPDRDVFSEPRAFALRAIPREANADVLAWSARYEELGDEASVLHNPHIYPVSEWQKERQRPIATVSAELEAHHARLAPWRALPVTHWMYEDGAQFAAIQTIRVSHATSAAFEIWQPAVARALAAKDFGTLAELFTDPPLQSAKTDIYCVRFQDGTTSLCDHQGRALPRDFWMTGRHTINDLTGLMKAAE